MRARRQGVRKQAGKSINRKGVCRLVWGLAIEECCELDSFSKHEKSKDRQGSNMEVGQWGLKTIPRLQPQLKCPLQKGQVWRERTLYQLGFLWCHEEASRSMDMLPKAEKQATITIGPPKHPRYTPQPPGLWAQLSLLTAVIQVKNFHRYLEKTITSPGYHLSSLVTISGGKHLRQE